MISWRSSLLKHKLRVLLLGLLTLRIDDCPTGGELIVRLERAENLALFAVSSVARAHPDSSDAQSSRDPVYPGQVVLEWASNWLSRHGGRMEVMCAGALRSKRMASVLPVARRSPAGPRHGIGSVLPAAAHCRSCRSSERKIVYGNWRTRHAQSNQGLAESGDPGNRVGTHVFRVSTALGAIALGPRQRTFPLLLTWRR